MKIIVKKMLNYLNWIYVRYLMKKNKVKYGKNICIFGIPIIKLDQKGSLKLGDNVHINSNKRANPIGYDNPMCFWTLSGGQIQIGNHVGISNAAIVAYEANVVIEDDVLIGGGVKIYSSDFHSLKYRERMKNPDVDVKHKDVIIKRGAFVGAGCIILKGVSIGEQAVIGAGSVVTRSIPANEIWGGNPAKFIKKIYDN